MKDQLFKFSRMVFVTSIALAVIVGLLLAFILLGGNAWFHMTKDDGHTIEAEVGHDTPVPDDAPVDSSHGQPNKSGF